MVAMAPHMAMYGARNDAMALTNWPKVRVDARCLPVATTETNGLEAAIATSLYFIFRTIGCFTGSFFLRILKPRLFFAISIVMMALSMIGLFVGESKIILYIAIALVGYGNSNVFSIVFSQALLSVPEKKNEVSGLMIMGLFGGTVFPLIMGFASDAVGQYYLLIHHL